MKKQDLDDEWQVMYLLMIRVEAFHVNVHRSKAGIVKLKVTR